MLQCVMNGKAFSIFLRPVILWVDYTKERKARLLKEAEMALSGVTTKASNYAFFC